jgi:hypothetical protein
MLTAPLVNSWRALPSASVAVDVRLFSTRVSVEQDAASPGLDEARSRGLDRLAVCRRDSERRETVVDAEFGRDARRQHAADANADTPSTAALDQDFSDAFSENRHGRPNNTLRRYFGLEQGFCWAAISASGCCPLQG